MRCDDPTFVKICPIIAAEFTSTGRFETHSFQGFVTGKICIVLTTASAFVVSNRMEFVTTCNVPRRRPSWLIRSVPAPAQKLDSTAHPNIRHTVQNVIKSGENVNHPPQ